MGRRKALLPLDGRTALERSITLFRKNGIRDIVVVTGHRSAELVAFLATFPVQKTYNPHYHRGMFSSVQTGVAGLKQNSRGFFLLPVDIPLVRPATVARLVRAFTRDPGCIIYPCFQDRRGHPPLIPAGLIPGIRDWTGKDGLRGFLAGHAARARNIEFADRFVCMDMDSPADYRQLQAESRRQDIPNAAECRGMLASLFAVSADIRAHSHRVAEVALALGGALLLVGEDLDLELLHAGAMLHDIAKGHPDHAGLGGQWLAAMGFKRVAAVVAAHTDMEFTDLSCIGEKEIVYLADKLVDGDALVTLHQRFESALQRHGHRPQARSRIIRRRAAAQSIVRAIEERIGRKLAAVLPQAQNSMRRTLPLCETVGP